MCFVRSFCFASKCCYYFSPEAWCFQRSSHWHWQIHRHLLRSSCLHFGGRKSCCDLHFWTLGICYTNVKEFSHCFINDFELHFALIFTRTCTQEFSIPAGKGVGIYGRQLDIESPASGASCGAFLNVKKGTDEYKTCQTTDQGKLISIPTDASASTFTLTFDNKGAAATQKTKQIILVIRLCKLFKSSQTEKFNLIYYFSSWYGLIWQRRHQIFRV